MIDYLVSHLRSVEHGPLRSIAGDGRPRRVRVVALAASVVAGALIGALPSVEATAKPNGGSRFSVATENDATTKAAIRILEQGGNAADAAVAGALVAGVTSPSSSGIGGGGFALIWTAATKKATVLDFRETAPRTTDVAAFERRPLESAPDAAS